MASHLRRQKFYLVVFHNTEHPHLHNPGKYVHRISEIVLKIVFKLFSQLAFGYLPES
jgi:hypothetical protein